MILDLNKLPKQPFYRRLCLEMLPPPETFERLQNDDPDVPPQCWYFNTAGLSDYENRQIRKYQKRMMQAYWALDLAIPPALKKFIQDYEATGNPIAMFIGLIRLRATFLQLAERRTITEARWRREADLLENELFTALEESRRVVIAHMMSGHKDACENGLVFLEVLDAELDAGLITLDVYADYMEALEQTLEKQNHPLRASTNVQ
jgi:hypothetical protein